MMVTLLCAIVPAALGATLPPSAFAQQEETSLGEEEGEDLAGAGIPVTAASVMIRPTIMMLCIPTSISRMLLFLCSGSRSR
jgi:hypothetical protein